MSILISRIGSNKHRSSAQPLLFEVSPVERSFVEPEKRSRCASGGVGGDTYDMPLHVAALFIIFFVSGFGCAFPILATRFPRLHVPASFLFFVSHFGTGVLIATAFVHLLPTAFTSLGNPCLSDFWTKDYPAMPGAIALGGIFLVTVIEMVFSPARHVCRGGNRTPNANIDRTRPGQEEDSSPSTDNNLHAIVSRPNISQPIGLDAGSHLRDMGPLVGRSASISRAINRMGEGNEEIVRVASAPNIQTHHEKDNGTIHTDLEREDDSFALSPEQKQKKETMQVYLLEMGILFHSVFIGMSLSVSVGKEFVVLLIAIVFHREFILVWRLSIWYRLMKCDRNIRGSGIGLANCLFALEEGPTSAVDYVPGLWLHVRFFFLLSVL
jgi:zinc transporter ZupT